MNFCLVRRPGVRHWNVLSSRLLGSDLPCFCLLCVRVRALPHVLFRFRPSLRILKFFLNFSKSLIKTIFMVSRDIFVNLCSYWVGRSQALASLFLLLNLILLRFTPPIRINNSVDWCGAGSFFSQIISWVRIVHLVTCFTWLSASRVRRIPTAPVAWSFGDINSGLPLHLSSLNLLFCT